MFSNTLPGFKATIQNLAGGQIISATGAAIRTLNAATTIVNAGLLQSNAGTAIQGGTGNVSLILQTGSNIIGTANGGGGTMHRHRLESIREFSGIGDAGHAMEFYRHRHVRDR